MQAVEYYFAFHPKTPLRTIGRGGSLLTVLGHVEAFGYTHDDTWFFFNPDRRETKLIITHHHDQVEEMMAQKFAVADTILKTSCTQEFRRPIHLPMNCVTQCAALIGMRAFTPDGFRRKLLRNNAEVIHGRSKGSEGRSGRRESA